MAVDAQVRRTLENDTGSSANTGPPRWRSSRYFLAYLVFLGMAVMFLQRSCFSLAIVCMVNHTALDQLRTPVPDYENNISFFDEVFVNESASSRTVVMNFSVQTLENGNNATNIHSNVERCKRPLADSPTEREDGPFVWDKELQGLLLGALFWGYMITQIPAGYVIYYAGPRLVVGVSMTSLSIFTMLCHPAAFWSPWAVFVLRFGVGIAASFSVAAMFGIWGKWAPTLERATLMNMAFSGQMIANAVVFPFSAMLCKYGFAGGWPSVFYVQGLLGLVWCIAWFTLVSDSPETHRRIDPDERDYIVNNRAVAHKRGEKVNVPWLRIFSSLCFWAIVVVQFTFCWGLFLFLSNLPLFFNEVMNFDIQSNGVFSMLPYLMLLVVVFFSGFLSDTLVRRKLLSVFWARRLFVVLSQMVPAVLLLTMSFLDCTQVAGVMILLTLAVGCIGFAFSAFMVNFFDIGGRFVITIQTVSTTIACIPGIVTPYLVAEVTKDKTREQWQIVFFITCGLFAFSTLFFCIFAKTTVQEWALPESATHAQRMNNLIIEEDAKDTLDDIDLNNDLNR